MHAALLLGERKPAYRTTALRRADTISQEITMATNQPHTKRDAGGDKPESKSKGGNPAKDKPGASSKGGGSKGKNDSGGSR